MCPSDFGYRKRCRLLRQVSRDARAIRQSALSAEHVDGVCGRLCRFTRVPYYETHVPLQEYDGHYGLSRPISPLAHPVVDDSRRMSPGRASCASGRAPPSRGGRWSWTAGRRASLSGRSAATMASTIALKEEEGAGRAPGVAARGGAAPPSRGARGADEGDGKEFALTKRKACMILVQNRCIVKRRGVFHENTTHRSA